MVEPFFKITQPANQQAECVLFSSITAANILGIIAGTAFVIFVYSTTSSYQILAELGRISLDA